MATNATYFDFLVRGVRLDAKDKVNNKSDPYIVIKIPAGRLYVPKQIITETTTTTSEIVTTVSNQVSDQASNAVSNAFSNAISNTMGNGLASNITNNIAGSVVSNVSSSVTQQVVSNIAGNQNEVNSQGTFKSQVKSQVVQTVKGQAAQAAATTITNTTGALVSTNLAVGGIVVVALLTNAAYHYARKTHPPTEGYVQIFETDVVSSTLNPRWKPFRLGLFELCHGDLDMEILIECYDWDRFKPSDLIGAAKVPVRNLISATDELGLRLVNRKQITAGTLYVQCRASRSTIMYCDFHASATDLARKDLFGLSDPYFVIQVPASVNEPSSSFGNTFSGSITIPSTIEKSGIQNHSSTKGCGEIFESHVIRKNLNPDWGNFRIGFYELCRGDPDVNLTIQCYDYNRVLPSSKIGSAQVSVRTLIEAEGPVSITLTKGKKKKVTGTFTLHCVPSSPLPAPPPAHPPAPASLFVRKPPPRVVPRSFGPPPYSNVSKFSAFSPSSPSYSTRIQSLDPPAPTPSSPCISSPASSEGEAVTEWETSPAFFSSSIPPSSTSPESLTRSTSAPARPCLSNPPRRQPPPPPSSYKPPQASASGLPSSQRPPISVYYSCPHIDFQPPTPPRPDYHHATSMNPSM